MRQMLAPVPFMFIADSIPVRATNLQIKSTSAMSVPPHLFMFAFATTQCASIWANDAAVNANSIAIEKNIVFFMLSPLLSLVSGLGLPF